MPGWLDDIMATSGAQPEVEPLLDVRGITRRFGERTILSGVDLDVAAGEAVGVVGPNGSGKSTLLRCIVGTDVADDGDATLDGQVLDERRPAIRRDLAVVMDDIDFFPDLSVVEHLDLVARAHAQPDAEEVVDAVLGGELVPEGLSNSLGTTIIRIRDLIRNVRGLFGATPAPTTAAA